MSADLGTEATCRSHRFGEHGVRVNIDRSCIDKSRHVLTSKAHFGVRADYIDIDPF
jgi:hypothetical protein